MKIGLLLDSFKGTLNQLELTDMVSKRLTPYHSVESFIISDGGDGFVDAIHALWPNLDYVTYKTKNCYHEDIESHYVYDQKNKTAWLECAQTVGISKTKERHPLDATSYYLGLEIKRVLEQGAKTINLGLGGSATNDCGLGMIHALGAKIILDNQQEYRCPRDIKHITSIEFKGIDAHVNLLSDVENTLTGYKGASFIYGGQKGLTLEEMATIDDDIINLMERLNLVKESQVAGTGAAGGLGFSGFTYLKGKMLSGAQFLLDCIDYTHKQEEWDIMITGEGALDDQSLMGKLIGVILSQTTHPKKYALVGINKLTHNPFDKVYATSDYKGSDYSLNNPQEALNATLDNLVNDLNNK